MKCYRYSDVESHLAPELRRLHRELLNALAYAKDMERQHPELASDGIIFSGWVRAYLVNALGVRIEEDEFALQRGFNLSITLKSMRVFVRVLKAQPEKMPQPSSAGQLTFYNQDLGQFSFEHDGSVQEREFAPNFVLKWSLDENRNLCELKLGYPKPTERNSNEKKIAQEWYWTESVLETTGPRWAVASAEDQQTIMDLPGVHRAGDTGELTVDSINSEGAQLGRLAQEEIQAQLDSQYGYGTDERDTGTDGSGL